MYISFLFFLAKTTNFNRKSSVVIFTIRIAITFSDRKFVRNQVDWMQEDGTWLDDNFHQRTGNGAVIM